MLSDDPAFRAAIARGADFLDRLLREDGTIYGVTTGYGDSCTVTVPPELVAELPHHLYTYHGCGLGEYLTPAQTRAVMATRLASLSQGFLRRQRGAAGTDRAPARRRPAAADPAAKARSAPAAT